MSLTKSKSVTDIPSSSYPHKEKERTSHIPILKSRKHKIDPEQTLGIEYEHKIKRNSSKHNLEPIHKIENLEIQPPTQTYRQEPSTSTSSRLLTDIGKKHKSRKDQKSSRSPSSSKSKKVEEDKQREKLKEDQLKTKDKPKEDKLHKNNKNNLNNSRSDINYKSKSKGDRKHRDFISFGLRYSSSADNLEASTSAGNLTYPQVKYTFIWPYLNLVISVLVLHI